MPGSSIACGPSMGLPPSTAAATSGSCPARFSPGSSVFPRPSRITNRFSAWGGFPGAKSSACLWLRWKRRGIDGDGQLQDVLPEPFLGAIGVSAGDGQAPAFIETAEEDFCGQAVAGVEHIGGHLGKTLLQQPVEFLYCRGHPFIGRDIGFQGAAKLELVAVEYLVGEVRVKMLLLLVEGFQYRHEDRPHDILGGNVAAPFQALQRQAAGCVEFRHADGEDRVHQPLLAAEMMLYGVIVGLVRGRDDLAQGDVVDTVLTEQALGGENELAGAFRVILEPGSGNGLCGSAAVG